MRNYEKARRLFCMAVKGGSEMAKCNLALMYQKGLGVPVDNRMSYALYMSAADAGIAQGCYGAGYHLYKGLGVTQSYDKAAVLLEKGAEKGHSGCDLLLATYYANSYDGKGDTEKAERHYRRASRHGNGWTVDVTKLGVLDSIQKRRESRGKWKHVRSKQIPARGMRTINGTANAEDITGRWSGTAYVYDWSRSEILSEEDIKLEIQADDDAISVSWYRGDSLCTESSMERQDEKFIICPTDGNMPEFPWLLTAAKFDRNDNEMYAALRTFSLETREKRHPVFAVLERDGVSTDEEHRQSFSILGISTSGSDMTIDVDAASDMTASAVLCSITGTPIQSLGTHRLTAGHNKITVNALSLTKGAYSVRLSHKGERHSKTITVQNP